MGGAGLAGAVVIAPAGGAVGSAGAGGAEVTGSADAEAEAEVGSPAGWLGSDMYFSPFESFARFSNEPGGRIFAATSPQRCPGSRPLCRCCATALPSTEDAINGQPVSSLLEGGDMSGDDVPLLGVAGPWGDDEIRLARQFEDLHQLLYTHGGISPTNAALEEVAKLIFIRLWSLRDPDAPPDLFDAASTGPGFKRAFAAALASDALRARTAAGDLEPLWPLDEPFRLSNDQVLAEAVRIVRSAVTDGPKDVSDPLGTAFDALLSGRYDHAGGLGTFLTPSSVARMMAEIGADLVEPGLLDRGSVGDPFCGTGRFLVALLETVPTAQIFGADQSPSAVAKARLNLLLYGVVEPPVWAVADSVTDAAVDRLRNRAALVLTNPPFGEHKYASAEGIRRTAGVITSLAGAGRIDPAVAGLVRCVDLLAEGGVLGIVLPDGVIESPAFDELVHSVHSGPSLSVVANVSLPTATFALSGTVAKTSAVFLRRARPPRRVGLARVDHVGYVRQAGRAAPDPNGSDLAEVSAALREGLRADESGTLVVTRTRPLVAIVAPGHSYDPSRLDPDALRARAAVANAGGVELRDLLTAVRPRRCREIRCPYISVLHLDDLGNVNWAEANAYTPSTPGFVARGGEVIVSLLNPARLRAAVIPEHLTEVQVSPEFGVFTAHDRPYAVLAVLLSDAVRRQLAPLGRGTSSSRRRIEAEDVLSTMVPKLDDERRSELDATLRAAYAAVADGRATLQRTVAALSTD
jgi:type I restriction enzyme M protein